MNISANMLESTSSSKGMTTNPLAGSVYRAQFGLALANSYAGLLPLLSMSCRVTALPNEPVAGHIRRRRVAAVIARQRGRVRDDRSRGQTRARQQSQRPRSSSAADNLPAWPISRPGIPARRLVFVSTFSKSPTGVAVKQVTGPAPVWKGKATVFSARVGGGDGRVRLAFTP